LVNPIFRDRGEILFFKKPSKFLNVDISFDKDSYAPGDKVDFTVTVSNTETGEKLDASDDIFLSLFVTDESVFD